MLTWLFPVYFLHRLCAAIFFLLLYEFQTAIRLVCKSSQTCSRETALDFITFYYWGWWTRKKLLWKSAEKPDDRRNRSCLLEYVWRNRLRIAHVASEQLIQLADTVIVMRIIFAEQIFTGYLFTQKWYLISNWNDHWSGIPDVYQTPPLHLVLSSCLCTLFYSSFLSLFISVTFHLSMFALPYVFAQDCFLCIVVMHHNTISCPNILKTRFWFWYQFKIWMCSYVNLINNKLIQ